MLTQKGTTMSPRMERLWRYIREERGITSLNDWSTDKDVEREQVALRDGERELLLRIETWPHSRPVVRGFPEISQRELLDLLDDYRTIMNRRPSERVGRLP